jgi:hypothetical protein
MLRICCTAIIRARLPAVVARPRTVDRGREAAVLRRGLAARHVPGSVIAAETPAVVLVNRCSDAVESVREHLIVLRAVGIASEQQVEVAGVEGEVGVGVTRRNGDDGRGRDRGLLPGLVWRSLRSQPAVVRACSDTPVSRCGVDRAVSLVTSRYAFDSRTMVG